MTKNPDGTYFLRLKNKQVLLHLLPRESVALPMTLSSQSVSVGAGNNVERVHVPVHAHG